MDTRNRRLGPWNSLGPIIENIEDLEAINVKCLWFESISSGTSGSITPPSGGTILLNEWAEGVDVLVSGISDLPTFEPVFDNAGAQITGTLDVDGNWTINGSPDTGYPIALVYSYEVALENFSSASCLESAHLVVSPAASRFFFGTFVETFDALITATGGVVTMSLEQAGGSGGDLTTVFSSGQRTFDCTPIAGVTLTAGSDDSPTKNFVYILETDPNALVVDTSQWPAVEHIKVCYALVPSAAYVETQGAYIVQNWNDHRAGTDLQGHLSHICETIRLTMDGAHWNSGIDGNGDTDGYITIVTGDTPDSVYFKSTSGVVYQMHKHLVPAIDTSGSDDIHVVNSSVTPYNPISDIGDEVSDSIGGSLSGRYYNIVMWGVVNKSGEYSPLMMNLPSGSYNSLSGALADSLGYDVYSIPREFKEESTTGFLICRITLRHQVGSGGTYTVENTVDLRGRTPGTASGSAIGSPTTFSDNQFEIFNVSDNTKVVDFDLSGLATANTRTITPADADMTLFSTTDYTDLTDGGESALHYHNALKDGGQVGAVYANAGAVELNYAGVKKFETRSDGISIWDVGQELEISSQPNIWEFINRTHGSGFNFIAEDNGGTERLLLTMDPDHSTKLYYAGAPKVETETYGMLLRYSSSSATFHLDTAHLDITNTRAGYGIRLQGTNAGSAEKVLFFGDPDGAVELYYAGAKTFETISGGATVTGKLGVGVDATVPLTTLYAKDNSGSDAIIEVDVDAGSGDPVLALRTVAKIWNIGVDNSESDILVIANGGDHNNLAAGEAGLKISVGGAVELYYAGVKTLYTTGTGITIANDVTDKLKLYYGSGFFGLYGYGHGDVFDVTAENGAGTPKTLISCDPDGAAELYYAGGISLATTTSGGVYITGDCSALSFTDRTPFYDGPAIEEINKIKGVNGKIDHKSLPDFARVEKNGLPDERNLGSMISILVKAVQELSIELDNIKNK